MSVRIGALEGTSFSPSCSCIAFRNDVPGGAAGACERESEYPNVRTQAVIDLPFLIGTRRMKRRYDAAIDLIRRSSKDPITSVARFPVDVFKVEASMALILADLGDKGATRGHAARAIEAAGAQHSSFRYHPTVGLVGSSFEDVRASLTDIRDQ
jgi:hypothetical protein